jgi:hypothetical protein
MAESAWLTKARQYQQVTERLSLSYRAATVGLRRVSRMIAATERTSRIPSGMNNLVLSGAGPSVTKPRARTTIAVVATADTSPTPASSQRVEIKQISVKIARPSGIAPEPTRVVVAANAEPMLIPIFAEFWTGSVMYLRPIIEKTKVAPASTIRLIHGAKRVSRSIFISSLVGLDRADNAY